tara:strand:- start:516 stop:1313 length:798 start_codon:yes stop_codon:yes gene_type:complete
MTTHFSTGVTNVRGKSGATSLFAGMKQPLITGGDPAAEFVYQNDFHHYNAGDWDVTSGGASDYQVAQYAHGWLRLGDANPAAGEITGLSSKEVWQYNSSKKWYYETSIAVTDVSDGNIFVGFADNGFVDPATVPTDCIGFSHLEDTTTIQFISRKNGAGTSFDMLSSAGGSNFTLEDSTIATQTATVLAQPSNSVRLGFAFQPAGTELGQTSAQYKLYLNGNIVGTQAATTVPDDIALELKVFLENKGTNANDIYTDYIISAQQR